MSQRTTAATVNTRGYVSVASNSINLIALELGGAAVDVTNLWPQPLAGDTNAKMKDAVENYLNRQVCRGTLQLTEAQRQIARIGVPWACMYRMVVHASTRSTLLVLPMDDLHES